MLRIRLVPCADQMVETMADEVLAGWPELEREDVYEALSYAAWAMEERIVVRAEAEA